MAARRALRGVRIADFTWAWAGPYGLMLLCDMGAEVIKIESSKRLNNQRKGIGPYPKGVRQGVNSGGWFNTVSRGRLSCTLDLSCPKGVALAREIIRVSDVVAENFTSGSMERLGLGYREVRSIRPDIIYLSLSGYGATGPMSRASSYGNHWAATAGLWTLAGLPGAVPAQTLVPYGDATAGIGAAIAIMAALVKRLETGEGQYLDVSALETAAWMGAEAWMEAKLNEGAPQRTGNRGWEGAPQGVYPCRGGDRWIAIAVTDDGQWRRLCRVMGHPEMAEDPQYADDLARRRHQDDLERVIRAWSADSEAHEAARRLEESGVAASVVMNTKDLLGDARLSERGFFVSDQHPVTGGRLMPGVSWKLGGTPGGIDRPAPLLGEHNHATLCDLLGLTNSTLDTLIAEGVIS